MENNQNQIKTSRLEAFSDGVIAIIITIMVLEVRPPHEALISAWLPIIPVLLAYTLSFLIIAIYWNNHHHLLRATKHVSSAVMWSNMFLLFSLSLVPVVTSWMGEHYRDTWPVVMYSFVGLLSGTAYFILTRSIIKANPNTNIVKALGNDFKGKFSQVLYVTAVFTAFIHPFVSYFLLASVAVMWLIPDRRLVDV